MSSLIIIWLYIDSNKDKANRIIVNICKATLHISTPKYCKIHKSPEMNNWQVVKLIIVRKG